MNAQNFVLKSLLFSAIAVLSSGCSMLTAGSQSPQIVPASTTMNVGQDLTFQVTGGTPPYQFQLVSGVGSVDGTGDYQAGNAVGQSQLQVTDANGHYAEAMVSVIQSNFTAANSPILGQTIAVEDSVVDSQGDQVHSKFVETSLKHPLVRVDELMQGNQIVEARAVVEDQFLVKLQPGYSETDLSSVLTKAGAHISRHLPDSGAYLVSVNVPGSALGTTSVSADYLAKREQLKQKLKTIAAVSPRYLSRTPATE